MWRLHHHVLLHFWRKINYCELKRKLFSTNCAWSLLYFFFTLKFYRIADVRLKYIVIKDVVCINSFAISILYFTSVLEITEFIFLFTRTGSQTFVVTRYMRSGSVRSMNGVISINTCNQVETRLCA